MIAYKGLSLKVTLTAVLCIMGVSFLTVGDPKSPKAQEGTFENIDPPDEKGPYNVGFTEFCAVMNGGRVARFAVFYPTLAPTSGLDNCPNTFSVYPTPTATSPILGTDSDSCFPDPLYQVRSPFCAVKDAAPAPGKFPLVVHDHGGGLGIDRVRVTQLPLAETLASHGFVVTMAGHGVGGMGADIQVLDFKRVIDTMLDPGTNHTPNAILDALPNTIDPERIGVSGHSSGGLAALRIAGGCSIGALGCTVAIPADPRVKAMVVYEPGTGSSVGSLDDASNISFPYLIMGGTQHAVNLAIPALFDATVLATPRIYVKNPQAVHLTYETGNCSVIDEAREAALALDPTTEPLTFSCPTAQTAERDACIIWNQGQNNGVTGFGCGRNVCRNVGVDPNSILPLDTNPMDGLTDSPPFVEIIDTPDCFTAVTPIPAETMIRLVNLYSVAFFKKFLEGDGRYMRYLTPGYAIVNDLDADVTIIEEEE